MKHTEIELYEDVSEHFEKINKLINFYKNINNKTYSECINNDDKVLLLVNKIKNKLLDVESDIIELKIYTGEKAWTNKGY